MKLLLKSMTLSTVLLLASLASSSAAVSSSSGIALPESRVTESGLYHQGRRNLAATTTDPSLLWDGRGGAVAKRKKRPGTTAKTAPNALTTSLPLDAISGIVAMGLLEAGLKRFFKAADINFPAMLGGCMLLFVVAVLAETIHPGWGDSIHDFLAPGSALLSKWLPSFFVPGLAMLPLAPSMGTGLDIAKAFVVVILGLVYSMSTVSFSVLALRKAQGKIAATPVKAKNLPPKRNNSKNAKAASAPKPFSDETLKFLSIGSVVSLLACVAAFRMDNALATPLQTTTLIFATLVGFVGAVRMPASITKVVHPLITSSAVTVAMVKLIAIGIGSDLESVLKTYKVGSLHPMKMGAGDVLLWLLGPSVVSFAVSMYSRKSLIYENLLVIITGVTVASAGGLFATAAFVRAISVGGSNGSLARLSLLPRNITTALAMVIANLIGGDISLAAVAVVFTGVFGATFGKQFLQFLGIQDPVTRGIGMGGSAQGLGVSAMSNEPDAFPFAAISMVLTAVAATIIVSIPASRDALISLATGDLVATP